ncbi:glutathione S-transferase 1-like [Topomyia yanbarensis]|uniref:glutathione S-transferase 1-like n=1 Tax=Topomyia yanbarensis TaxID=2498891 RepID=UPI00273BA708|nr:glutathione S-transferase 1-like [Topomyia yanbarensis]
MEKIKLYSNLVSPPGRTVQLTAKAIGLDLEFHSIDILSNEQLSEQFIKMNPLHTIPVIGDSGTILYDSHAIAIYLIMKYAPESTLYSQDPAKQAKINAILHFESGVLFARLRFMAEIVREASDMSEIPRDRLDYALKAVELLEALLMDKYLAGSHMTLADISCMTSFSNMDCFLRLDREKFPKVFAWFERMKEIPGYWEINQAAIDQFGDLIRMIFESNKKKENRLYE